MMNRPVALVCYICGRQFGTKSLAIHIKSCQKKWQNQQNLLEPKKRRPCPQPPKAFNELNAKDNVTRQDIINFNSGAFDTYMQQALVTCEYCGRKFNEKSLIPHQKACKINPMIRKHYVSNQEKANNDVPISSKVANNYPSSKFETEEVNLDLTPCRKCGRKFNSDRVAKHQNVCKQTKAPLKKIQEKKQNVAISNKPNLLKKNEPVNQKMPKWKLQSEELQKAMKAMKQIKKFQMNGGNLKDLPPPPPSNYDHYVQCKYCGRKYAAQVAQRHIPKCANIINKPGGIQPSKIQEKYVGSTGVKKPEPVVFKGSTITKPVQQAFSVQATKSSILKPNFKPTTPSIMKKK